MFKSKLKNAINLFMCEHDWIIIGETKHLRYDEGGQQVVTAHCYCSRCGSKKSVKFYGHTIGNLFEKPIK